MTSMVDGHSALHVVYSKSGVMHFIGYDSRVRAAEALLEEHQMELEQDAAIASMEALKLRLDQLIKHRKQWYVQQTCPHDWIETSAGRQCLRPGCELFVKNDD